jgi:hypothetical protein
MASGVAVAALAAFLAATGCSQDTGDADASSDKLSTAESELKLAGAQYAGRISSGETRNISYTSPPAFRALGFDARGGDVITVDVASEDGDAMGWITDSNYNVLASNDDASPNTLDARVTYTVPKGVTRRPFRIVMREYDQANASFAVKLSIAQAAPPVCQVEGKTYQPGASFPAPDGCNTCSCGPNGGTPTCTRVACLACNPAAEPNRSYLGTPTTCMTIRFSCPPGSTSFQNTCGCGCERVN